MLTSVAELALLTVSKFVVDSELGFEIVDIDGLAERAPGGSFPDTYYTFSQPPDAPCGSVVLLYVFITY
jgi:hypothetical protein